MALLAIVVPSSALVSWRFNWLPGQAVAVLNANKMEMNVDFIVDRRLEQEQHLNRRRAIKNGANVSTL
jgi:hypothetical protein